ncbi:hypothetical protein J1N35_039701 [Gossypium stocksii]|uniref:Uncharacterized protein n=1 Tax=Gossypium stocksii TaxID=47602 RepID=A0A9D3UCR2_9ROSI|nr:hypothetical protein J1N35_039701 [Gossypium stocksii]
MRDFQECLTDHVFNGPQFTWSNHQKDSFLARKLDRVLANDVWLSCFPRAPGAKPFRSSNFWAKYPDFMKTVEQSWVFLSK